MPKFATIDEYLETLSPAARASFVQISLLIHQLVPNVQETFSYGVPAFKIANQTICLVA